VKPTRENTIIYTIVVAAAAGRGTTARKRLIEIDLSYYFICIERSDIIYIYIYAIHVEFGRPPYLNSSFVPKRKKPLLFCIYEKKHRQNRRVIYKEMKIF